MKKTLFLLLILGFVLVNCKKNDDGPAVEQQDPDPQGEQQPDPQPEPNKLEDYPCT